ncbi:MAG: hypothetical protein KDE47_06145, partial [Caldilineaceae bacterium]|nr:hypothetical protein [Caldilineaceae bacterium]
MQRTMDETTANIKTKNGKTANSKAEAPSVLSMRLLGSFEILAADGQVIDLGSRKAQALFAYLVVNAKSTPRDTLIFLFWPEMAENRAKNNLRTTLSALKQKLAPHLDITTSTVTFNRHQPYFLDTEAFQNQANQAIATQNLADLQAAVDLYQGEFLQGFHLRNAEPFEEWLLQQREHLHIWMLRAFETLVTMCAERGEYSMGLAAGYNLLTMEPWSEVVHRQLMILLANSGQRESALTQYERCRRILADELGIEPTQETTALYQQIQAGTFKQAPLDNASTTSALPTTAAATETSTETS